jgi:hypothetical protein
LKVLSEVEVFVFEFAFDGEGFFAAGTSVDRGGVWVWVLFCFFVAEGWCYGGIVIKR